MRGVQQRKSQDRIPERSQPDQQESGVDSSRWRRRTISRSQESVTALQDIGEVPHFVKIRILGPDCLGRSLSFQESTFLDPGFVY